MELCSVVICVCSSVMGHMCSSVVGHTRLAHVCMRLSDRRLSCAAADYEDTAGSGGCEVAQVRSAACSAYASMHSRRESPTCTRAALLLLPACYSLAVEAASPQPACSLKCYHRQPLGLDASQTALPENAPVCHRMQQLHVRPLRPELPWPYSESVCVVSLIFDTHCHLQNTSVRPSFLYSNNPVVNDHWSWFKRALTYNVSSVGVELPQCHSRQALLCLMSSSLGHASSAATGLNEQELCSSWANHAVRHLGV